MRFLKVSNRNFSGGRGFFPQRGNMLCVDCKIWQILERRKASSTLGGKNGLLELAFLEKKKNKTQHSFIKHFFFAKVFALEHFFVLTRAYLSKQTFIPFYYRA